MRRRLTLTLLGVVLATLVIAGVGTLVLARVGARASTEADVASQAASTAELLRVSKAGTLTPAQQRALASGICDELQSSPPGTGATSRRTEAQRLLCATATQRENRREQVERSLQKESITIVTLRSDGGIDGELPTGISADDVDVATARNETVSGSSANRVYAVAPIDPGAATTEAVAISRPIGPIVQRAGSWFLLSALVTVAIAALAAAWLGRRLTQPLREATIVTGRIAGGDLGARLPEHFDESGPRDELDELAHAINTMAENLERSRGLEQQFLLSVSHDLRTPLTSIRGYAEALADGAAPDPAVAGGVILSESRRLERLVRDLLDLARLDSRQFTLHPAAVELAELAGDTADGFRRELEGLGLTVTVEAQPEVWAWVDADRVQQVLANLVENASKFASERIVVRAYRSSDGPVVEVADDGPGIAPEDLPHVFERLYVAGAKPRRKETGSGLGLAIVHELVGAMGGSVTASAEPGGGARMVVRLPAAQPGSAAARTDAR